MLLRVQVITGKVTEDEYDRLWATNVKGSFDLSKRLATVINEGALRQHRMRPVVRLHCSAPCLLPGTLQCRVCRKQRGVNAENQHTCAAAL